jgi:hypothetical protein
MDEIISYKICAVKVRNAKLRNYLKPQPKQFPTQILAGSLNKRECRVPWRCQEL